MKKRFSALLAGVLSVVMLGSVCAHAVAIETDPEKFTVNGVNYEMWSTLYKDGKNTFRGSTWVSNPAQTRMPEGHFGVSTYLCDPTDTDIVYAEKAMRYNSSTAYFYYQETNKAYANDNGVICGGEVAIYNGTRYEKRTAPQTRVTYPGRAADGTSKEVMALLDENGGYPVTAAGESYGPITLTEVVGSGPDLIWARGVDETKGYIRAEDLQPDVNNPEEAAAYMAELKNNPNKFRMIPLYDLEGNVIGSFEVTLPTDDEVSPEAQETIDKLEEAAYQSRLAAVKKFAEEKPNSLDWEDPNTQNRVMKMIAADGGYHVNSKGETYGSVTLALLLGEKPDLIYARGTEGQSGYYRERDTIHGKFDIQTPADAMRYMEYLETAPEEYLIPLYDCEGNVIGEFLHGMKDDGGGLTQEQAEQEVNRHMAAQ